MLSRLPCLAGQRGSGAGVDGTRGERAGRAEPADGRRAARTSAAGIPIRAGPHGARNAPAPATDDC